VTARHNIGVGDLFETIGLDATNALLAFMEAQAMFKNVVPLLRAGTLNIRSPLVAQMLPVLVTYQQITQENATKLLALGQPQEGETVQATITLPTGTPCHHDATLKVVTGGTFGPHDLVEVDNAADGIPPVAYQAYYILTGEAAP
jgi:hypothetical protein